MRLLLCLLCAGCLAAQTIEIPALTEAAPLAGIWKERLGDDLAGPRRTTTIPPGPVWRCPVRAVPAHPATPGTASMSSFPIAANLASS